MKYSPIFSPEVNPVNPGYYAAHGSKDVLEAYRRMAPTDLHTFTKFGGEFVGWYWDGQDWFHSAAYQVKCFTQAWYWFGILK